MNGWGWFGMAMMVIVSIAIVALVFWAIARQPRDPQQQASASEQLDARLARGDIDTQEYRERLEALSGHRVGK